MTRDEAIEEIKQVKFNLNCQLNGTSRFEEAFEMAIKALEQQTCEDAVSREAAIDAVNDVIADYVPNLFGRYEALPLEMASAINRLPSVNPAEKQEPCEDAVSRQAVLDIFADNADVVRPYSKTWEEVKALPSVNPQSKTGHWIEIAKYSDGKHKIECSECGGHIFDRGHANSFNVKNKYRYCPSCGAKMIEPQESEVSE